MADIDSDSLNVNRTSINDGTDNAPPVDVLNIGGVERLATDAAVSVTTTGLMLQPEFTFTKEFTGQQNNVFLFTPTTGKKIRVLSVMLDGDAIGTPVSAQLDFATSSILIWKNFGTSRFGGNWVPMTVTGAVDEKITLNTEGFNKKNKLFVIVGYNEV